jgi:hypothetical protein
MFQASSLPIIRSYQLYTWQLVRFIQVIWPLPRRVRLEQFLHETHQLPRVQLITPDDGQRRCPKHVEFREKIKFWIFDTSCWLFVRRVSGVPRDGGRVLLAVLNLYIRSKNSCGDIGHWSVTDSTQSISRCFSPKTSWFCSPVSRHRSPWTVDVSGEMIRLSISLRLAVDFLHVMYIKGKQMLVLNFIFDLLWTGRGSSVSSAACLGFRKLK